MITGDSTMRVFDYHEIVNPKFDPSNFLKQATRESTQKIEVPLNFGQHYFIFLPPALVKEYQLFNSRRSSRRRRFKRHHPTLLQNVLGELQNYALVPIQSSNGQVRYVLLKNPKFVISGVGPSGAAISATIPVSQQSQQALLNHRTGPKSSVPAIQSAPVASSRMLPQIADMLAPMTMAPPPKPVTKPTSRPWKPSRARPTPLTRNNRPRTRNNRPISAPKAKQAKKAILGERDQRPIQVPSARPFDSLFNEMVAPPEPAAQVSHVHSHHIQGHVQSHSMHTAPSAQPHADIFSQNIQSAGHSTSMSASVASTSTSTDGNNGGLIIDSAATKNGHPEMKSVDAAISSVTSGGAGSASTVDGPRTHTVHQTEIVETVIETKNQKAAVAKSDTAAVSTNQSFSTKEGPVGSVGAVSQASASSAASATSAVAAKQEKVVSTKKTTTTTKIKKGVDAGGKPAAVHEVTEVVEHTSAAHTGTATATKTDAAATSASSGTTKSTKDGTSGGSKVNSASSATAAASSSASVTSNNATTTVKKKTITKTTVTKTASGSALGNVSSTGVASIEPAVNGTPIVADIPAPPVLSLELLGVNALDSVMPQVKRQRKSKKPAKTAILSENNDRKSVGIKAALIPTQKPKLAAKVVRQTTQEPTTTTTTVTAAPEYTEETMTTTIPTTTEEVEMEDMYTTTSPSPASYDYPMVVGTTPSPRVAGWSGSQTTDSGLGPMDRINTTDVPEEIEARPDKTPAEMRRELIKLNPNLPRDSPALIPKRQTKIRRPAARRNSRQRPVQSKGNAPRSQRRPLNRRRNRPGQDRTRNRNGSRNNPGYQNSNESRAGPRPRTRDPMARWLWNNLEGGELFENMPFWMFLK